MSSRLNHRLVLAALVAACLAVSMPGHAPAQELQLDSLEPGSGSTVEATPVTLTGSGFAEDMQVALVDGGIVDLGWDEGVSTLGHNGSTFFGNDGYDFVLLRIDAEGHLVETGRTTLPGDVTAIALDQDLAVAVVFDWHRWRQRLIVIDVSDRGAPVAVGEMEFPYGIYIYFVAISDSTAAWTDRDGFHFLDLADPARPVERGMLSTDGGYGEFAMAGGLLYFGRRFAGLLIIDYSDPDTPRAVLDSREYIPWGKLLVSGRRLFFFDYQQGLMILDLADPAKPTPLGSYRAYASGFDVDGDLLAAHFSQRIALFDISDPTTFVEIDAVGGATRRVDSFSFYGGWIIKSIYGSVHRFDARRTRRPVPLFHFQDRSAYRAAMAATEEMVYVSTQDGLEVWKIDGPEGPQRLGVVAIPDRYTDLLVRQDYLYALSWGAPGLVIFDLSDPQVPTLAARIGEYTGRNLKTDDKRLYIANPDALIIFDLEDPLHPVETGRVPAWSWWGNDVEFTDVCLDGYDAYIVSGTNTLFMADVSDPASAHLVWEIPESWGRWPDCCAIVGDHLYVGSDRGVAILKLGSWHASAWLSPVHWARDLRAEGGELYVSDLVGLKVFDTSRDPLRPPLRSATDLPGSFPIGSVALDASKALVVGSYDLAVVSTNPVLESVQRVSESRVEFTVPAGMNAGPYHVLARQAWPPALYLGNASEVVESCPLEASLTSDLDPLSGTVSLPASWVLSADGDERFFEPDRRHRAWLELPPLGDDPALEKITSAEMEETIEIHLGPEGATLVKLTGPDPEALAQRWASMVEQGGISLTADSAYRYQPLELNLRRESGGGQVAIDPEGTPTAGEGTAVYRYTLLDGALVAATARGPEVDHRFRLAGETASGCEAEDVLSVFDAAAAACIAFNEENPSWRIDCPAP